MQQGKAKWNPKYVPLLEALLMRHKFDFGEVQPAFNMLLSNMNKKLMKSGVRF